jgi:prepilin-type N-terminal cleavage/methylation domain-containing protein
MSDRGFSLVEALIVMMIVVVMAGVALPPLRAHLAEAHLVGAGQQFKSQFRLACSAAIRSAAYTAIRFERRSDGSVWYAVYQDGDNDGVLSADILSGHDHLLAGPFPLTGGAPGVRVGINTGIPALPPEHGQLSGDPVRFGVSDILSFSPLGTATPGTFYLADDSGQAAVRVTGGSARVRLMVWRGGIWRER